MDKLKLAVIGTGSVVREIYQHLYFKSEYSDFIEICAVAEPNDGARKEFCDKYSIPENARFKDYRELFENINSIDAAQINTPDSLHSAPTIAALEKGLHVLVPKPTASKIKDAHAMIKAANKHKLLIGIDFHKREDPRIKECAARYRSGRYGKFQTAIWYMLDKLCVADPNHRPRFFTTANFAESNSPVSFLTVHMADAFLNIIKEIPVKIKARGFSQKLPSLKPIPVNGYDLVDTEIEFFSGSVAHIVTGWHLPNTAHSVTVQSSRIICTDGIVDLGIDSPGFYEIHESGLSQINPLFKNFEPDGKVSGYGMRSPGNILKNFLLKKQNRLSNETEKAMMNPFELGFYTTVILEGAEESLRQGEKNKSGVTIGKDIDLKVLVKKELGEEAKNYF